MIRPDRRTEPRVEISGSAVFLSPGLALGPFTLRNLSSTGALLRGLSPYAVGHRGRLALELRGGRPIELMVRVVREERRSADGPVFAVVFENVSAELSRALRGALLERLRAAVGRRPSGPVATVA
ncbi:MAG: PilZ domain-containing protein [Deltaproteobacteria bacterium]